MAHNLTVAVYTFIDGQYLRSRFETIMGGLYGVVPPIDFRQLTLGASRIFYYDAIEEHDAAKETFEAFEKRIAPRRDLHQYINRIDKFHVREGYVRKSTKKEQKAVDVLLAVDALEHAARGNLSNVHLLAGDLDFEPLVKSLVRLGVRVDIHYCALSVSNELLDAADGTHLITAERMWQWTFEKDFQTNDHPRFHIDPHCGTNVDSVDFLKGHAVVALGNWNGRRVRVFEAVAPGGYAILFVDAGTTLLQTPIQIQYPDRRKLGPALELNFGGAVKWE